MGLKKFVKKVGKFAKKAVPIAAGMYGASKLFGGGASAFPVSSGSVESQDLGTLAQPNLVNWGSGTSPGLWGMAGNLAGPLLQGGMSLAGGLMANNANAKQAQQQMDFQSQMSNTSYQRGVKDMQDAGLNPMLAYSQGGASSAAGASATMSDVVTPSVNSARAGQMQAESINNMRAQNANINAQTQNTNADTLGKLLQPGAILAGIDSTRQNISSSKAQEEFRRMETERGRQTFESDVAARKAENRITVYGEAAAKNQADFQATAVGAVLPYITGILGAVNSAIGGAGKVGQIVDIARSRSQRGKIIDLNH